MNRRTTNLADQPRFIVNFGVNWPMTVN